MEEKYVLHILDNYERDNSGYISPGNLVELAKDLGIKPWHVYLLYFYYYYTFRYSKSWKLIRKME